MRAGEKGVSLARIYVMAGEQDKTIDEIEALGSSG
jgi:hypothetical protein